MSLQFVIEKAKAAQAASLSAAKLDGHAALQTFMSTFNANNQRIVDLDSNFGEFFNLLTHKNDELFSTRLAFLVLNEYVHSVDSLADSPGRVLSVISYAFAELKVSAIPHRNLTQSLPLHQRNSSKEKVMRALDAFKIIRVVIDKFYKKLEDFNDTHKKIKQAIHDDIKYVQKVFETLTEIHGKLPILSILNDSFIVKQRPLRRSIPIGERP